MSLEARVILRNTIDGRVYLDMYQGYTDDDYRQVPALLKRSHERVMEYVEQVGAYAIVKGGAPTVSARPGPSGIDGVAG